MSARRVAQPPASRARARRAVARLAVPVLALGAAASLAAGLWIPAKAGLAQILLERAWSDARQGNSDARPWPWADTSPIARLSIPQLDAAWIVLAGASGRNLAFAPSHLDGSAGPGEPGVMLIAGHRDTHFEILEHIEAGAELILQTPSGELHRYAVTRTDIVDSTTARIRLDAPAAHLVLTTCYPFDARAAGGPLRYVVQAELLPPVAPALH